MVEVLVCVLRANMRRREARASCRDVFLPLSFLPCRCLVGSGRVCARGLIAFLFPVSSATQTLFVQSAIRSFRCGSQWAPRREKQKKMTC
ncbi:hypothetical protein Micbo1qcDRAFT_31853 [Microdochium bolleyi]|uniref:Uncharacterized protein n=1 Tax=Microdochium bolleyi TaxID=196109 RepID=A0A136IQ11_9PEZI|nr:hypothetical protein Micbo1qcDRAFT_31853 [Microdochium bolleyi]